jgi:hypothetical protein
MKARWDDQTKRLAEFPRSGVFFVIFLECEWRYSSSRRRWQAAKRRSGHPANGERDLDAKEFIIFPNLQLLQIACKEQLLVSI